MKFYAPLALLIALVSLDLGFTFWQLYGLPLEGDLPVIVLPDPACRPVLHDPFGWAALTRQEVYVAPNRFFAHAAMVLYFKTVPFGLQGFLSPASSVYAACALFGTAVQALLLYLLAGYAGGQWGLGRRRLWLLMLLLLPLFQIGGYNDQMGVIDQSVTYTFFYAFPLALLLVLLRPFYLAASRDEPLRLNWLTAVLMLLLMVVLAFNGAIVPATMAVVGAGMALYWLIRQRQAARAAPEPFPAGLLRRVPWRAAGLLAAFGALCLYSLYIGRFEAENTVSPLTLWERYLRLPAGIQWQFRKPGLPVFVGAVLVNFLLIWRFTPATAARQRLLRIYLWLGLFGLVFVLLLPFGGYREYRPFIIRRDSALPITLGLLYFYALSTCFLWQQLPARGRPWFRGWIGVLSAFYLLSDALMWVPSNACERRAFAQLAAATEPVVALSDECTVMAWGKIRDPQESVVQAELLAYWGITWNKRLYHQPPAQ